jgi:hypothetical protein
VDTKRQPLAAPSDSETRFIKAPDSFFIYFKLRTCRKYDRTLTITASSSRSNPTGLGVTIKPVQSVRFGELLDELLQ